MGYTVSTEEIYARRSQVYDLTRDRWPDILAAAGVNEAYLRLRKAGPCPLCRDGTDRYTFDDRDGDGDYCCRHCGAGKGVTFLMKFHQWTWIQAVDWALAYLGQPGLIQIPARAIEQRVQARMRRHSPEEEARRRARIREVWQQALPVVEGDPVHRYLTERIPGLCQIPKVLRYHPGLEYFEKLGERRTVNRGKFPAMVAAVQDSEGRCCNIHRTYLGQDGRKAEIAATDGAALDVKKLMPGVGARSSAIRLASGAPGHLGVAEGIETALAAQVFAQTPTWSVVSTSGMRSFFVPEWVTTLTVFADNDHPDRQGKRPGFEAAHALAQRDDVARRVAERSLRVLVRTPSRPGSDIADLLMGIRKREMAA